MNGNRSSSTISQGMFIMMGFSLSQSRPTWWKGLFMGMDLCYAVDVVFARGVK
jgi:hypothetical protein